MRMVRLHLLTWNMPTDRCLRVLLRISFCNDYGRNRSMIGETIPERAVKGLHCLWHLWIKRTLHNSITRITWWLDEDPVKPEFDYAAEIAIHAESGREALPRALVTV